MSLVTVLLIVWGVITAVFIILLIYRGTLGMHEDEQLFLDEASSSMRVEQEEVQKKMARVAPLVKIFGAASGVLILVIAGMAIWQRVNQPF
jgi:hypothetical protein